MTVTEDMKLHFDEGIKDCNAEHEDSYVTASLRRLHLGTAIYRETSILHSSITTRVKAIIACCKWQIAPMSN